VPAEARAFGREALLDAFDRIGRAAAVNGVMLDIYVYGGSALMLASNFRFASEDVDIAALDPPRPAWLDAELEAIARERGWSPDWLNDAVSFHLSPLASRSADHHEFGTFPRGGEDPGLRVSVPTAEYLLALKLKAMRVNDPRKGAKEVADIQNLLRVVGVSTAEEAVACLTRFFPRSAADADRQRFFLRHIWPAEGTRDEPPRYPL
jgi:hypothetical protein